MASVTCEKKDGLCERIAVQIDPSDYATTYHKALQETARKTNLQGFRKGQAPLKLVEKMYGKSILAEKLYKSAQDELFKYLHDSKTDILFQPLLTEDTLEDLQPAQSVSYTFRFDIGVQPEIRFDFVKDIHVDNYEIKAHDTLVEKEVERLQQQLAEHKKVEQIGARETDYLIGIAKVDGGEQGDMMVNLKDCTQEAFDQKIKSLVADGTCEINIEKDIEEKERASYLSQIKRIANAHKNEHQEAQEKQHQAEAESCPVSFEFTIKEIRSVVPASLDEVFYEKIFAGEKLSSADDFKRRVREQLEKSLMRENIRFMRYQTTHQLDKICAQKEFMLLPEAFIHKWMDVNKKEGDAPIDWDKMLPSIRREIVQQCILKEDKITWDEKELRAFMEERLRQQLRGYGLGEQYLSGMLGRAMQDESYVRECELQLAQEKAIDALGARATQKKHDIDSDAFEKIVKAYLEKINPTSEQSPA